MTEQWRTCEKNPKYEISNFGNLRFISEDNNRNNRKLSIVNGKHRLTTPDCKIQIDKTVLTAFDRPPGPNENVWHMDGNKLNDNIENLKWISGQSPDRKPSTSVNGRILDIIYEDSGIKKRVNSIAIASDLLHESSDYISNNIGKGFQDGVSISDIEPSGEIRMILFGDKKVYVSSDSLIKHENGHWKEPRKLDKTRSDYIRVNLPFDQDGNMSINGKGFNHDVHTLVATAFHGPKPGEKYTVDHKCQKDKTDNRPENLEWVKGPDQSNNCGSGYLGTKKVYKYTLSGEYTCEFNSTVSAADSMMENDKKGNPGAISSCCNGKKDSWKGFEWSFYDPENYTKHREEIKESVRAARIIEAVNAKARRAAKGPPKTLGKRVYGHVIGTDEIIEWKSGKDADDKTKIGRGNISNYAKDKKVKEIEVDILDEEGKIIMEENIPKKRKVTVKFSYEN